MEKEKFESIVGEAVVIASNDVEAARGSLDDREKAIKNFKSVSELYLDYLKLEKDYEETKVRLENDKNKHLNELELKRAELELNVKKNNQDIIWKNVTFGIKTIIMIGSVVACHRFETGGSFTSTLARSIFPSFGKTIADNFNKM